METIKDFCISYEAPQDHDRAALLALRLNCPFIQGPSKADFYLSISDTGSFLRWKDTHSHTLAIDFLSNDLKRRAFANQSPKELLLKACGIKANQKMQIIDATAGLGRDAFLMAAAGASVLMLERSPILAFLLEDALLRLKNVDKCIDLSFLECSAQSYLKNLAEPVDIIYLDPMHPTRKKSALVKLEMRIIRQIVGTDEDADDLLALARTKAKSRIVVKRPRLSLPLNNEKPDQVFTGKQCRFDVYTRSQFFKYDRVYTHRT